MMHARLALACAMAFALAIVLSVATPVEASTYWCNDGTAVSNAANCKIHGGYTPIARVGSGAASNNAQAKGAGGGSSQAKSLTDEPCIFDRWGNRVKASGGCSVASEIEEACLSSGGALAGSAAKRVCIPRSPAKAH